MNPDNLPSIFPWTKAKESRRQLIRKEPLQRQNLQQSEPSAMEMETTTNINDEQFFTPFNILIYSSYQNI